jgi:ferritin
MVIADEPIVWNDGTHIEARGSRMQINETMNAAFNDQITMELQAAHNYLAMGAWFESAGFSGMAAWMHAQFAEETAHAMKFYQFVLDRDGRIALGPLAAPPAEFDSALSVFEKGLAQERDVSASINNLYALAMEEKDFASLPLLDWFITEQIEEEATFSQILDDLALAGGGAQAMLFLDRELGSRGVAAE